MYYLFIILFFFFPSLASSASCRFYVVDEVYPIDKSASAYEHLGNGAQTFDFHIAPPSFRYQCDHVGGGAVADVCTAISSNVGTGFPAGTASLLSALLSPNDTTCTHTFTLYKNGSSTAMTCSMTNVSPNGLTRSECHDTAHSISVASGDTLLLRVAQDSTCSSGNATPGVTKQGVGLSAHIYFCIP